jgi:predicted RNA polymerase sigma factor
VPEEPFLQLRRARPSSPHGSKRKDQDRSQWDRSFIREGLAREFLEVHGKVMGPGYAMETEIREMFPFAGIGIKATTPKP